MNHEQDKHQREFTLEDVSRTACEIALRYAGHMPTLIAEGRLTSLMSNITPMPTEHEQRIALMHATGFLFAQSGQLGELVQVFFICEAWLSLPVAGEPPEVPPSQDPNHTEVLIISHFDMEAQQANLRLYEMQRTEGQLVQLNPMTPLTEAGGSVESPLLDAFVIGFQLGRARLH